MFFGGLGLSISVYGCLQKRSSSCQASIYEYVTQQQWFDQVTSPARNYGQIQLCFQCWVSERSLLFSQLAV